jgi:exonuclease SbcD
MTIGQEHTLLLSTIANRAFDYVALGHIHRGQVLFNTPPVVYSGSLDRLDFGDEGVEKGFYVVDIDGAGAGQRRTTCEFHPVEGRRFLTINVALEEADPHPLATVLAEIELNKDKVQDAIVRLQLTLPAVFTAQLPDSELRKAMKSAYFLIITRDIRRESRIRLGTRTAEGLTQIDALKLWLESKNTPPERIEVLLDYARRLVEGEKE